MNNEQLNKPELSSEMLATTATAHQSAKFGMLLRSLGAVLIITAALCFMLNQWNADSHIMRYFSFLGLTSVICGLGLFLGLNIKEEKAARTLLGVAATMVPINFLQLGALIYSRVMAEMPSSGIIPSYDSIVASRTLTQWIATDNWSVLIALLIALPVLTGISSLAFKVFCRLRAKSLLFVFMATNLTLLLPFRSPSFSIVIACTTLLFALEFLTRKFHGDPNFNNREGELLKLMIPVPAFLITLRTLSLYNSMIDSFFIGVIMLSLAIAMVRHFPRVTTNELTKESLQRFALPLSFVGWTLAAGNIFNLSLYSPTAMLSTFLSGAMFTVLIGQHCRQQVRKEALVFALVQLTLSQTLAYLYQPEALSIVSCILASILGIILGTGLKATKTVTISVATLVLCLLLNIRSSFFFEMNPWISLGALGILAILASVVWEKYSLRIKDGILAFQNKFSYPE